MESRGISVRNLTFRHPNADTQLSVDEFVLQPGRPTALVGPSGSGKTTLLRLLTGLLAPAGGVIRIGAQELGAMRAPAVRNWRLRQAGLIFQDFALLPYLTARENVELPSQFFIAASHRHALSTIASGLAEKLGLTPHWNKRASLLSQGERQRVAIARALAHRPDFIFADEPTASLDPKRSDDTLQILLKDARDRGATLLVITHEVGHLSQFDEVLRMEDYLS